MPLTAYSYAATELLKNMTADLAAVSRQTFDVGDFADLGDGVAATVICPTGEHFRVTVEHIPTTNGETP